MKQLDSYRFYELGAKLHSLFSFDTTTRVAEMFAPLSEAQTLLDSFIKGDAVVLATSKSDAVKLLNRIGSIFNRYFIDPSTRQLKTQQGEDRIDAHELSMLRTLVEKFEHALAAELNRAPTYVAGRRGIYSTYDLAENAEEIFSDSLRASIPAPAQAEFTSAGRALAFSLGTAAAMHTLRAIEIMLRSYYEAFTGNAPAKAERNYSAYVKKLAALAEEEGGDKQRPDKRVIQMLAQVKDHYRNPLVMVESAVSVDEATQLFGMASAIISLMAEAVAHHKPSSVSGEASATDKPVREDDSLYDFQIKEAG